MASYISIESLDLENFGPFYGENKIDFRTKAGLPPHVLIGGKNGAGKTHLLRALYLAVVGRAGVDDLRKVETGSDATRFGFGKVLNRRAAREGADCARLSITLKQTDADSGKEQTLTLDREIRFRPSSPPDWFSMAIRSNDEDEVIDEQMIERLRDAFLPRHLARFFFFDAEKSQNVQLGEATIVDGVSRILGLWPYERLEQNLRELFQDTKRELSKSGSTDAAAKLGEVKGEILRVQGLLKNNDQDKKSLQEELLETNAELSDIEDNLKTLGAIDPDKLQSDQVRREEIADAKREIERQLADAWEKTLPVALLGDLRTGLYDQLVREETRRNWEDRRNAIEPKLPGIQKAVFDKPPADAVLAPKVLGYYSERLSEALRGLFHPPPDGVEGVKVFATDRSDINQTVRLALGANTSLVDHLAEDCRRLDVLQADVRDLDYEIRQQMQNVAAIGAGKELHERRARIRADVARIEEKIADLDTSDAQLQAQLIQLKVEEDRWAKLEHEASRGRSLASRAHSYREAAAELRKRASNRLRAKIGEQVGKLWTNIVEREREFTGMEFDPLWNCMLLRRKGARVSWDDINPSAGQRQVRLLAFYEALRRLAQTVPPLVVDTPLGRLDREVRTAVVEQLYLSPNGHQSIVLATNAEVDPDGALFAKVRDQFGLGYTLEPDGEPGSEDYEVHIEKNYFGKRI